ncbi:glycoside hydrolase family 43 protein [Filimonas effusa]|uniref:Glycosyl hydrolase 43 family protein n=1 Tax=Filimonas effusa TaxID=2508721 RepID=A0A4Q1DBX5_9BACT|nr:glycoside hydrolase 43 family protein [Filimonas effusa]RXK86830.1 glycosyl hydrolase 43 family protein [Filimonas effusa]
MNKVTITILSILCILSAAATHAQEYVSKVWVADQGNGYYKNPILHADYSDPDVIRVGDDYYMTASSFNCMPGLPILHSKDLVNWKLINHALTRQLPVAIYDQPQHGNGVWAPAFQYHNNEFYIYYPDPDYGIYRITAKDPAGKWSEPELVLPGKGIIDPSAFWDDDGKAYLAVAWAGSRAGVNSLLTVYRLNPEGNKVIDEGRHVYDGHNLDHTVEGPKFFKRNGYYYLLPPAGGVTAGWQLALRSRDIYGPYERKVVMDQGSTAINGPHQGAMIQTPAGESWFIHFQDKAAYGRVVHLQPVTWKDNWPVIGNDPDGDGKGEPVLLHKKPAAAKTAAIQTPAESDEFNDTRPGLQWQWHANPQIRWSAMLLNTGFLRLFAFPAPAAAKNLWPVPNLLLQKLPAPAFTATVKMKFTVEWEVWQTKKAGLLVMGNDYAYLSISKDEKGYKLSQVLCKNAGEGTSETIVAEKLIDNPELCLRVTMTAPDAAYSFSFSEDGQHFQPIGIPCKAQPDKWIGAKLGLFCTADPSVRIGGYADIDWFRIEK